jgi:tetratricopeptide (TPR) repeat protein
LALYQEAAGKYPQEPIYDLKLADLYLDRSEKKKALAALDRAWALGPSTAKILRQMGEDYQKLGAASKARLCFERAGKIVEGETVGNSLETQ